MPRHLLCLLALLPLPMVLPATAQPLNVKTGAWEMTHKSAVLPRPLVEKECVTKADLAEFSSGPDKEDDDKCAYVKPPAAVGNKWSADKACKDGRKVHAEFVAESPERIRGTVVATVPQQSATPIIVETSGRWLGASCAGIK